MVIEFFTTAARPLHFFLATVAANPHGG